MADAAVLTGGIISTVERIRLPDGRRAVMKTCATAPPDLYRLEASALDALRLPTGLYVPQVLAVRHDALVLEDLGPQVSSEQLPAPANDPFWDVYGRGLAHLHGRLSSRFGFDRDTYWGLLKFDNRWCEDGWDFYAQTRYLPLLRRANVQRTLSARQGRQVEMVAGRLRALIPPQPPCLNHGDLWAGNRARAPDGRPALIDPFIHYGWAEMDLHNCLMYGGFPPRFFDAYIESHPLEPGWRERLPVLFIPHLLALVDYQIELAEVMPWLGRLLDRFAG